jgi:predicted RNase H-like nuclease (RuvC/YqgF family)
MPLHRRSKNVDKKDLVFCVIILALGAVFAGILGYIRDSYSGELADARRLSVEYRSELDRAAERITSLEAGNSRLNEHLRSASGNVERLESLTSQTISDTRAASRLVKEITIQVESLVSELDRWRSGSDSGNGMDNLDDL